MVQLDSINYTSSSEYSPRTRSITHLQIHHATTTSLVGLRALMAPGGRTVSANGAMGNDGHLMGVVPESMRAFTSATSFDNNSYTIEVCNTSLSPTWGISDACHWRLARVAVDLHKQYGMPLNRAHIIGHNEVPGTYATACPGPSMDLNRVVRYAHELLQTGGGDPALLRRKKETENMYVKGTSYASVYAVFTDDNGKPAMRACAPAEQSYAVTAGIVTTGYDSVLTALAKECGYGRIIGEEKGGDYSVMMKKAANIATTYALYGPGYWDETTDPALANAWARSYGNAENVTFAEWDYRKSIAFGNQVDDVPVEPDTE